MHAHAGPVTDRYDRLAPFYDEFTHDYGHDRWLVQLERLAKLYGLRGTRVLDVACGTGKSLRPLLALGYDGEGCDLSASMLREARERMPGITLFEADMRALPRRPPYEWITCINDAVNHLIDESDLRDTFTAMAQLLAPGGLVTFDVNTFLTHRRVFEATFAVHGAARVMCWHGEGCDPGEAALGTAEVTVFSRGDRGWQRTRSQHRERWWSDATIEAAAATAGLSVVGRHGQRSGAVVDDHVDERHHAKVVYFLARR